MEQVMEIKIDGSSKLFDKTNMLYKEFPSDFRQIRYFTLLIVQSAPPEIKELLPWKWEFVGDIAIIRMDRACDPCKDLIGRVYADVLGVSTVCVDRGGVAGEFRRLTERGLRQRKQEAIRRAVRTRRTRPPRRVRRCPNPPTAPPAEHPA